MGKGKEASAAEMQRLAAELDKAVAEEAMLRVFKT